jgi:hypothetical protein
MPFRRALHRHPRIFSPSEIDVLQRVFDKTVVPNETMAEREDRAFRLMSAFQTGIRDENELIWMSRERKDR